MQISNAPSKISVPFASSGSKQTIPVASQISIAAGRASYTDGFPPLTMTPIVSGGVPPFGTDMNGILNAITAIQQWQNAGGFPQYDSAFSTAVGGYPKYAILQKADGTGLWISTADNNTNNPDTGGANWVDLTQGATYGLDTGTANTYAVTYAPAITAIKDGMVLRFKAANANTGASTFNPNGLGAKPIVGGAHAALQGGEIVVNSDVWLQYNSSVGTGSWILVDSTGGAMQAANGYQSQQAVAVGQLFGGLKGLTQYTSSGSFTVPLGVTTIYVSGGAGGGGGGGSNATTSSNSGGAGGGGAGQSIIRVPYAVTPGQVLTVTIGAPGTAGAVGGAGGNGGNTSLGALVSLTGGVGGSPGSAASATNSNGGVGGAGFPGGNYGGDSGASLGAGSYGGGGGASPFGASGRMVKGNAGAATGGTGASGYCAGGSGAGGVNGNATGAGATGGAGAPGILIIEW